MNTDRLLVSTQSDIGKLTTTRKGYFCACKLETLKICITMRLLVIVGCVLALPYVAKAIFYTSGGGLYYYTAGGSLGAIAASPILSGLFDIIAVPKNSFSKTQREVASNKC